MIVGIATENPAKINACQNIFDKYIKSGSNGHVYYPQKVETGITDMPLSISELQKGSQNRAVNLFKQLGSQNINPDLTVGLEGGFFISDQSSVFLQSWVYIFDGTRGYWGASGAIQVPDKISTEVLKNGRELAEVIDEFTNLTDIRSRQGAVGIFTENRVSRSQFFEQALIFAISPILNRKVFA